MRLDLPDNSSSSSALNAENLMLHLSALRRCVIHLLLCLGLVFLCLLPFSKNIYDYFALPLLEKLPEHSQIIATDVTATFIAPFKLTLFVAFLIALPFLLFRLWQFISPALYFREKKNIRQLFWASLVLFYTGVNFALWIVLPSVLYFFMHIAPESVLPMTDISSYLSFCLKLFFTFGFCFEIPVFIVVLVATGLVSLDTLIQKRKFFIVACFFISMFITPPDIMSMLLLAIPMCILFEFGLLLAQYVLKPKSQLITDE